MINNFRKLIDLARCFNRIRPHLRGGRWLLLAVFSTALLMSLFEGVGVGLLVPLLSLMMGGENSVPMRPIQWLQSALPNHSTQFYVGSFAVLIILAIGLKNLTSYLASLLASRFRRRVLGNLRASLFDRLHNAELQVFEQRTPGEISNLFFGETLRTTAAFDAALAMSQRLSMALVYFGALLVISWSLTLFVLGLAALIGLSVTFVLKRLTQLGAEGTEATRALSKSVMESFAAVRLIRATHSVAREKSRFEALSGKQLTADEQTTRAHALMLPITETVGVAGAMFVIVIAYSFYVSPGLLLSSHLFGYCFILLRLIPLINQLYLVQGHLLHCATGVELIEHWLELAQHPERSFGSQSLSRIESAIRFESVEFSYGPSAKVLNHLTFSIPAGQTVALVGASGSGKSTIASLLLRLRPPSGGRITIDGTNFWEFTPDSWHRYVAMVDQDTFLFQDTIAANITYGLDSVAPEAVDRAVDRANLREFVESLPDGLNTPVGDRGIQLSGGQRQRVAIARALVRDPQFLILDEATSSLDTLSERQVQTAIENASIDRTVLVIAHRLSTVQRADKVVVLDKGTVVEEGDWDTLIAQRGRFYALVNSRELNVSGPQAVVGTAA